MESADGLRWTSGAAGRRGGTGDGQSAQRRGVRSAVTLERLTWTSAEPYERGYEHRSGTAVVALDPHHGANRSIVDLDRAARDPDGLVRAEATVAPARVRPNQAVRIHVVFRLDPKRPAHWNNEAEPLRLWIDPPEGWQAVDQLLLCPAGKKAITEEERALDFEVKAPARAKGKIRLNAYALYHICEADGGQCRFLLLDIPIDVQVGKEESGREAVK